MSEVPESYCRILENRIESIVASHLSRHTALADFLYKFAFPDVSAAKIDRVNLHVDRDHRHASTDALAYGETDIEAIAVIEKNGKPPSRVALLIEMKVDARQMDKQGLRYRARADYRQLQRDWSEYRCILMAPRRYLDNAYPLKNHQDAGWDLLVALEDVGRWLAGFSGGIADAFVVKQAVEPSNAWNLVIPEAAVFWRDLGEFQRVVYPDVPIFINRQHGAGLNIWPSFFENELALNKREVRRKRIQIALSGKRHVALFVKNVQAEPFRQVVEPLLQTGIRLGAAGGAWQSVRIDVDYVDPQLKLAAQTKELETIFNGARRLYDFFIEHETSLLSIATFK